MHSDAEAEQDAGRPPAAEDAEDGDEDDEAAGPHPWGPRVAVPGLQRRAPS